jgi:hypothetical protein
MRAESEYAPLEQRYITGGETIRGLSAAVGKSFSAVASWARKNEWKTKREAYRASVSTKALARAADADAEVAVAIRNENVAAMRATVYKYMENLNAGKVTVGTREAVSAIQTAMLLLGEATVRTETKVIDSLDPILNEDLREVLKLARARVVSGGVAESLRTGAEEAR